ncbi:MAG: hypothetical protein KAH57_06965 [Thermoplasmata archaeon]|nr:hypothetical protein [Thermoplasmata archaeon]
MARIREMAHRMFAVEFNSSRHEDRGLEENAPNYIYTPLGAHVNRLYFIGNLMSKTNSGTDESPMYKAEVRGPTGTFYLFAGQYQPQPLMALAKLEAPELVGVVGKVRTFVRDDGAFYVSVKPEMIFPVTMTQRDMWIVSTAETTIKRLRAMKDSLKMEDPSVEELSRLGHEPTYAKAGVDGVGLYGMVEMEMYLDAVKGALSRVIESDGRAGPEAIEDIPEDTVEVITAAKGPDDVKERVLAIINDLSGDKGALYRDIMSKCEEGKINKIALEETIQELLDEGAIYEPTIGIIKPI